MVINSKNLQKGSYPIVVLNLFDEMSSALIRQFGMWAATGIFDRVDKKNNFNYFEGLKNITTPMLFCVGQGDKFIWKENTYPAYENITSENKEFLEFGKESCCEEDYGHMDIVVGQRAPLEVFPKIEEWLDK